VLLLERYVPAAAKRGAGQVTAYANGCNYGRWRALYSERGNKKPHKRKEEKNNGAVELPHFLRLHCV
jgi:hypothetical protein